MNTYIKSNNFDQIALLCSDFVNVIGPLRGRAATVDDEGNNVSARGDPSFWYAVVTTGHAYTFPYNGVEESSKEDCEAVCGVVF